MKMCTTRNGVKYLPISAQGLPASGGLTRLRRTCQPVVRLIYPPQAWPACRTSGGFTRSLFYQPLAGLSAGCVADWRVYPPSFGRTIFGKRRFCEEKCTPIIIRNADKALHSLPQGTLSNFFINAPFIELFSYLRASRFTLCICYLDI
jgi:hypothetical protein